MFDFKREYIIKNEIVELIPLESAHTEELFLESNHKDIWQYFTENGFGRANFEDYILNAIQKRNAGKEYPFVIKDLRTNSLAGMTRIYNVDKQLKNLKIGHTWIGRQFQGTGLNKNCKYLLFEFLFDELMMERIGFGASAKNIRSIKAMESVGCKKEGLLRGFLPDNNSDTRTDIVLLSILKREWDENVRVQLRRKIESYV